MAKRAKQKNRHNKGIQKKEDASKKKNNRLLEFIKSKGDLLIVITMASALSLLLLLGPFFRGLFFPIELLTAQAVIFGLLVLWGVLRLVKKDDAYTLSPIDICYLVLLLAYVVSFQFAAHKRDALEEVLKIAAYIVIYLVSFDICRYLRVKNSNKLPENNEQAVNVNDENPGIGLILNILLFSAFVIAIISIGGAVGNWSFIGAYEGNRIASPMGYANTAAAYFMASYLLSLGLVPIASRWFKLAYLSIGSVLLILVILTFSRGAWLFLPPLALLMVLFYSRGERLRVFLNFVATAIISIPLAFVIDSVFRSDTPNIAWLLIILGMALVVGLGWLIDLFFMKSRKFRLVTITSVTVLVLIVVFVITVLPLMRPIHLGESSRSFIQQNNVKQIINDLNPGSDNYLELEVDVGILDSSVNGYEDDYWGVRIIAAFEDYDQVQLLDYRGSMTDGWEKVTIPFKVDEESDRYEIQVFTLSDQAYANIRSASILSDGQEENLSFIASRVLPQRFYNRIYSFSRDRNIDRRYELFQDAIKVIKDYPLTGTGGGGFAALYHAYQDQFYYSREVHNHFLQVWVEAGVIGFLAYIGIWLSLLVAYFKNLLNKKITRREKLLWTASLMPILALGAHSMIDWNFSMAAVGIFLFTLFGAARSMDRTAWFKRSSKQSGGSNYYSWVIGAGAIITGIALLIFTLVLLSGLKSAMRSQDLLSIGNIKTASLEMEKAIWQDPYRASSFHNLSVLAKDQFERTGNQSDLEQSFKLAERAYELEPFSPSYLTHYSSLLLQYGDYIRGLDLIDRVVEIRPFDQLSYSNAIIYRLLIAESFLSVDNKAEAKSYLDGAIEIADKMENKYGSMPLNYEMGRVYFLIGKDDIAESYFQLVDEDGRHYEAAQEYLRVIKGEK